MNHVDDICDLGYMVHCSERKAQPWPPWCENRANRSVGGPGLKERASPVSLCIPTPGGSAGAHTLGSVCLGTKVLQLPCLPAVVKLLPGPPCSSDTQDMRGLLPPKARSPRYVHTRKVTSRAHLECEPISWEEQESRGTCGPQSPVLTPGLSNNILDPLY